MSCYCDLIAKFDEESEFQAGFGQVGPPGPRGPKGDTGRGLNILGVVESASKLPSSPNDGDVWSVGTAIPYDLYIYSNGKWTNLGPFRGPAGSDASVTADNIKTALGYTPGLLNRNLLLNPFFSINQRGKSTYSGEGYCFDCWEIRSSDLSVTKNSDGSVTLKNNGSSTVYFRQKLEVGIYSPTGFTISANISAIDGKITAQTAFFSKDTNNYGEAIILSSGMSIGETTKLKTINGFLLNIFQGASITIKAVKLESGKYSTLANDMWPNYAEELLKCQRFFIFIGADSGIYANAIGVAVSSTSINFFVPLPITMRSSDITIKKTGSIYAAVSSTDKHEITAVSFMGLQQNGIWINATTSGLTPGNAYILRTEPGTIQISSEL